MSNYAILNKRGFQLLKPSRVKSRIRKKVLQSPGSGVWTVTDSPSVVNHWSEDEHDNGGPASHLHDTVIPVHTSVNAMQQWEHLKQWGEQFKKDGSNLNQIKPREPSKRTKAPFLFSHTELNMSDGNCILREERKKALRETIAALKRQVDEQEEDKELQQLMWEEQELRDRLNKDAPSKIRIDGNHDKCNETTNRGSSGKAQKVEKKDPSPVQVLHNLTGVKFDMSGFLPEEVGTKDHEFNEVVTLSEHKATKSRKGRSKKKRVQESESELALDTSDSQSDEEEIHLTTSTRQVKGKVRSGLYDKLGDTKLVSNEWFAHTEIDEALGGDRDFSDLSFNLLVAELEIIGSGKIGLKEKSTRIEVLKKLAYKKEFLPTSDVLAQYTSFLSKIEKGKYRWGSKSALAVFEQQLMCSVSLETAKNNKVDKSVSEKAVTKDRYQPQQQQIHTEHKKYCLDCNRGQYEFTGPHKGTLNGIKVMKHHTCKKCLIA